MKTNQRSSRRSVLTISTLLTLSLVIVLSSAQNVVAQQQNLTRTLPLTVNNEVDIGSFAFTNGGGSLWISVTVPSSGYSVAKEYLLPIQYNQNTNIWQTVLPASSTGGYSGNDFALDVKINGATASLRLRTTASDGTNVGTAYVSIKQEGLSGDTFTPSTSTGAANAPTTFFTSTALTQVGGNVGVGTSTPASAFHVATEASGTRGITSSQHSADANGAMFNLRKTRGTTASPAAAANGDSIGNLYAEGYDGSSYISGGRIRFLIDDTVSAGVVPTSVQFFSGTGNFGGVERMRITSAGNVGIGTASPGYKLDLQGGQFNASGGLCIAGDCKTAWSQVGGSQWTTSGSNIYYNSGNVGIGTATPDVNAKLHVYNAAGAGTDIQSANAAGWARLRLVTGTHSYGWFTGDSTQAEAPNKIGLYDYTAGAFRMMIDSSGNVGVGTTTPSTKLHVVGDGTITGNLTVTGNIAAKYQDVAEWVESSQELSAGTVVVLDQTKSNQVIASSQAYDTRVAGVISVQPGIALGEGGTGKVLVATTGRVRIKVDALRGAIQVGDLLVTSDVPGVAMKSQPIDVGSVQLHRPGTLIGKALEPLAKGSGEILVLLSLQ